MLLSNIFEVLRFLGCLFAVVTLSMNIGRDPWLIAALSLLVVSILAHFMYVLISYRKRRAKEVADITLFSALQRLVDVSENCRGVVPKSLSRTLDLYLFDVSEAVKGAREPYRETGVYATPINYTYYKEAAKPSQPKN